MRRWRTFASAATASPRPESRTRLASALSEWRARNRGSVRERLAINVLGGFGSQFVLLASGVLAARLLGVEDRGHLALLWIVALVLAQGGGLGLPLATTYWLALGRHSGRDLLGAIVPVALIQMAVLVGAHLAVILLVFGDEGPSLSVAALATAGAVPAMLGQQYALAIFQGLQSFSWFNVFRLAPPALYSSAMVALFAAGKSALPAVALAWVGAYLLAAAVAVALAIKMVRQHGRALSERPLRRAMLTFGLRGMLGSVTPLETFQLDQAVVGAFISPAALGVYVVGLAFTNLPRFVAQSIGFVAYPEVARRPNVRLARRTMWRMVLATAAISGAIAATLAVLAPWLVPLLFGPSFSGSAEITRILLVGAVLIGVRRVLSDGARGAGHPLAGTIAEISSWAVLAIALPILASLGTASAVAVAVDISAAAGLAVLLLVVALTAPPRRVIPAAAAHQGTNEDAHAPASTTS